MGKKQIVRIIIERNARGLWDVVREREQTGEACRNCSTLEEAFDYVRAYFEPSEDETEAVAAHEQAMQGAE